MRALLLFSRRGALGAAVLLACAAVRGESPSADYVAHEWGTFTSIQGSDGVPLRWNPFLTTDLPGFVFNRQAPSRSEEVLGPRSAIFQMLESKQTGSWLQRMETPVIYFHSENELSVDVHVRFPKGRLTEWFPQVTTFGPVAEIRDLMPDSTVSHLRWDGLRIRSQKDSATPALAGSLPVEEGRSHYYPARQATANLVESTRTFAKESAPQRDRLLFYRGAGDFSAPLRVSLEDGQQLRLFNQTLEPLGPAFAVQVQDGRLAFAPFGILNPGTSAHLPLPKPSTGSTANSREELATALRAALTDAGLYGSEAAAMVATWRDSWLGENGIRVLYLIDRTWTDRTLPLELNPPPRQTVRVMVGRADVIPPSVEWQVADLLAAQLTMETRGGIPEFMQLGLGRFLEPALTRAGLVLRQRVTAMMFSCSAIPAESSRPLMPLMILNEEEWTKRLEKLKFEIRTAGVPAQSLSALTP